MKTSRAELHCFFEEHFGKPPMISEVNPHGISSARKDDFMRTYPNIRESLNQSEDYALIEKVRSIRSHNHFGTQNTDYESV